MNGVILYIRRLGLILWSIYLHNGCVTKRVKFNPLKFSWLLILVVFVAGFGWFSFVPYFRQGILPIDPNNITGDYDPQAKMGEFHGISVASPEQTSVLAQAVLGLSNEPKHIEVDLTNQKVYAFEGDKMVYSFSISSGKWGKTPTGVFHIWGKFRYTRMTGGSTLLHTYYDLPNVPYVMFFSNDKVPAASGFSLHGTYWHSNFGHPMSHGCVNMKTEEAGILYRWTSPGQGGTTTLRASSQDPGTEIIIYGTAPRE